ncbi:MAG TPA: putative metal-dependent hydrolase [Gemmatimonadaceae bacterium]|jgi:uncharacterized damage-inducible protein DinB|nr:putative metal-dependent hydrolase [Gemmatimonadaceae bacterium]
MDLAYPVGKYQRPDLYSPNERRGAIDVIANAPAKMRDAVRGLDDTRLDTPYRPGGWTVRQVVHHVPDSHMNAFIRFKLALTEDNPTIKPYDQDAWSTLEDARSTPIEVSLVLLDAVHDRWLRILRAMAPGDFSRTLFHPENGPMSLDQVLAMYEWHSRHHTAHIVNLRARNGWS